MSIEELIKDLQAIAAEHPGLVVKARQGNGYLFTVDEVGMVRDTFGAWLELA